MGVIFDEHKAAYSKRKFAKAGHRNTKHNSSLSAPVLQHIQTLFCLGTPVETLTLL